MLAETQLEVVTDLQKEMMGTIGVGVMMVTGAEGMMTEAINVRGHQDGIRTEIVVRTGVEEMTTEVTVHRAGSHVVARLLRSWMLRWMLSRRRFVNATMTFLVCASPLRISAVDFVSMLSCHFWTHCPMQWRRHVQTHALQCCLFQSLLPDESVSMLSTYIRIHVHWHWLYTAATIHSMLSVWAAAVLQKQAAKE